MTNSWKRRASNLILLAALTVAALFPIRPTAAAVVEPEALLGGKHWRYVSTDNGPVHVWTPPGYDAATAITVIHVHGDAETKTGADCEPAKAPYVTPYTPGSYSDAAWVKMKLAEQFNASGLNALFIFPDGPVNGAEREAHTRVWKSLDGLLASVKTNTGQQIPDKIVVSGHSGAFETMHHWTGNSRVAAFVLLDSTFREGSPYYGWYDGGAARRLAVVHTGELGESYTGTNAKVIAEKTGAKVLDSIPASTEDLLAQDADKRAVVMKSQYCHADIIRLGQVIPVLLPWAAQAAVASAAGAPAPTTADAPAPAPTTGGGTPRPTVDYGGPTLEISIPNVEFSDAIRQNGEITIPWLAQYIGGVYAFLLSIAGLLAAVMMVIGGFQYVTSAGDKGKLGAGKKKIVNALIGLVLALGSYAILYVINPGLVKFEGLKLGSVETVLSTADSILDEFGSAGDEQPSELESPAPGLWRSAMWNACGDHHGYSIPTEEGRRGRLKTIVAAWKKIGVDEGGAVYVRGGSKNCTGRLTGQLGFVVATLSQGQFPLSNQVQGNCRKVIEKYRAYHSATAENKAAALKVASDFEDSIGAEMANKGTCHIQFQMEYKRIITDQAAKAGMLCGDCQSTMASLYECFDSSGAGYAQVQSYVPVSDGAGGCKPTKAGIDQRKYVIQLDKASSDGSQYTLRRYTASSGTVSYNDIAATVKKYLKFGDIISIVGDNTEYRHTFMYTGGAGLPYEILEMGGGGKADLGSGGSKAKQNAKIPVSVSGMGATTTVEKYFEKYAQGVLTCVWARRPLVL